jgi:hypothetical protein
MKFDVCGNSEDFGWVFAEYEPGKRVTKEMLSFDIKGRQDVRVNIHGVVLFYNMVTALRLLEKDFSNT